MVSVIVPVYNIEQYLPRCLDSILTQTYSDLEILLIDDGSTDSSGSICDQYEQKDSRIRVYHQENCGVAVARNKGLDMAQGEYIGFVDGDDLLDKNMFRVLYENAVKYQCEISCCQLATIEKDGAVSQVHTQKSTRFCCDDLIRRFFFDVFVKDTMYSQCNKIFRADVLKDLRYKTYKYGEDILFVFEAIGRAHNVYYDSFIGYYYLHRDDSAMRAPFNFNRFDYIDAIRIVENTCEQKYPFAEEDAHLWVYQHVLVTLRSVVASKLAYRRNERVQNEMRYLKEANQYLKKLSIKRRLDYWGIMYFPPYIHMVNWVKRKVK